MTRIGMELKLEMGEAAPVEPRAIDLALDDNPAIAALTEEDREIWSLHRAGIEYGEIARILRIGSPKTSTGKAHVCRRVKAVSEKLHFIWRFWKLLRQDPAKFQIFLGIRLPRRSGGK
jgi:DNA-binding CsgD family transcriptional regulator